MCVLRVLDFRSVQEGLRVERLTDCADAGSIYIRQEAKCPLKYEAFYILMPQYNYI